MYGPNFFAHEVLVAGTSFATQLATVTALAEAGVQRIVIPMGQMPFRDPSASPGILSIYDAIVDLVRFYNIDLAMWITYSNLYYSVSSVAEWTTVATSMLDSIIDRYNPEFVSILHEPITVSERIGVAPNVGQWTTYMTDVAAACVTAGATEIAASFTVPTEEAYLNAAAAIGDFTGIELDIYSIGGLSVGTRMAATALAASKRVTIAETWRPSFSPAASGTMDAAAIQYVGHSPFCGLDEKWVYAMNKWSRANGVTGVTPIWTQCYFAYGDPESGAFTPSLLTNAAIALARGQRAPVFDAVQRLTG
jgi:hypothetical protein